MTSVSKFYKGVINDVIDGVKNDFEDDGLELNALEELRKIWELKLSECKAVDLESSESKTLNASSYVSILNQRSVASATGSALPRPNLVTAPSNLSQQHLVSSGSGQPAFNANKSNVVRIVTNSQQVNNGGQIYHPSSQHVNQNQVLSNAAHMAHMALPSTIYPTNSQNSSQNQNPQTIISNRVNIPAGGTRSFQILRPTPGHMLMAPNVVLQPGPHFGASSVLTTNSGPVSINHIAPNAINNVNGKPYMHQTDGAGDSTSEDDDDDDLDDLVAVEHARIGGVNRGNQRGISRIHDFISAPDSLPPPHSTLTSMGGDGDDSDEEEEDDNTYDQKPDLGEDEEKAESESGKEEEQPLNSEDDVSDEEADKLFETENVVVCQYDKINRSRNKWRFHLKDGIMNLNGKDRLFQKANGDAEW